MGSRDNCQCPCGQTQFGVQGRPLLRAFCHCTICQAFNQAPYADVTLFRAKAVNMPSPDLVEYRTYRPPPAIQRGVCPACHRPALEVMNILPMPKLVIVPSANIRDPELFADPSLHIFYNHRVDDVNDGLPKFNGYLNSQLAFGHRLIRSLLRPGR